MSPKKKWIWCCCVIVICCARVCSSGRSDKETRDRFYGNMLNSTAPESNDGSLAKMFDRVLEKEFSENDQPEGLIFLFQFYDFSFWFCLGF